MPAGFRFVHTADLHLGAPFKRVGADDPRVRDGLLAASATALDRVVDLCLDESVDFLVIAGDVLDGSERNPKAQRVFHTAMLKLAEAGIVVYVARGNHDPADGRYVLFDELPNVHYFSSKEVERVVHERDGEAVCALYGRSYPTRKVTEDYAADFRRAPGDEIAIGVLHANLGGRPEKEPYAPASVDDLRASGMDYWALGHIHAYERVLEAPLSIYAGSPQGIDPNEPGAHGCVLVEIEGGTPSASFVETGPVRWGSFDVDLSSAEDIGDVRRIVRAHLEQAAAALGSARNEGLIARIRLTGRSAVHAHLTRKVERDDVLDDVREFGMELSPWLWVDRMEDSTADVVNVEELMQGEGFIAQVLQRSFDADGTEEVARATDEVLEKIGVRIDLEPRTEEIMSRARDLCLDALLNEES